MGRLLLLALIVGLGLCSTGSNGQSIADIPEAMISDVEKIGACVATKVFFPPSGAGPSVGCDYVLKLAAAGSWPGSEAQYLGKCCSLLTTEATSDCICPLLLEEKGSLLDAMDSVCKNGELANLREQCGGGANNTQDGANLAGELGACVARKVFSPPRGAGEPRGCDYVLGLAADGRFPATEKKYINQCCDLLTTEAESGCICPFLESETSKELEDAMGNLCMNGEVATLTQKCQEKNNAGS